MNEHDWEKIPAEELEIVRKHCRHETHYENKSVDYVKPGETHDIHCVQCGILFAQRTYEDLMKVYRTDDEGPICCTECGCYIRKDDHPEKTSEGVAHSKCFWGED